MEACRGASEVLAVASYLVVALDVKLDFLARQGPDSARATVSSRTSNRFWWDSSGQARGAHLINMFGEFWLDESRGRRG